MPTNLSEHFTLKEMSISEAAARNDIDNTPDRLAPSSYAQLSASASSGQMKYLNASGPYRA